MSDGCCDLQYGDEGLAWHVTNHITSGISKSNPDRLPGTGLAVGGECGLWRILYFIFMICVSVLQQINPGVSILIISDMFVSIFLYCQSYLLLNIKILWKTFYTTRYSANES